MTYCPKCGQWSEEGSAFCANCGNPLSPAEQKPEGACPKCGQQNEEGSAFCVSCGSPLSPGEQKPEGLCPKCGKQNPENSAFCVNCGAPLRSAEEKPTPAAAFSAPSYATPAAAPDGGMQSKSKKGLMIGIIAAAAAAVVLIFIFAVGTPVTGVWYDTTNGAVLEFAGGDNVYSYTAQDTQSGKYEYNKLSGEGRLALGGQIYSFVVVKDKLNLQNAGIYLRAADTFDVEQFLNGTSASAPIPEETAQPTQEVPVESPPAEETEVAEELPLTLSFAFGEADGTYSGEMTGGLPNGQGTFTVINEDDLSWIYVGMWVDGHFSGEGVRTWDDGYSRGGTYAGDQVNGTGWQAWDGNTEYEGSYADSEFNGQGTLYNRYGTLIYSGAFVNGLMQESAEARSARVEAFKAQCAEYPFQDVFSACENDIELFVQMTGTVYDVDEADYGNESNPAWVYLELPPGEDGQMNYVTVRYWMSEGEVLPMTGEEVILWGTTREYYEYEDESGNMWWEPVIEAWTIEPAGE